ncbi:hypothetical protein DL766_001687 [Monosporascus sp. MC13-8B]|uniref:TauD/TfdA-like domain-containing protein n=1 Tax=Monosporascus cannonballus TaxID=155416 RepID=A0ABY0H4W4_9PEZI|nr:hypothetical protein DL762_005454 [Monosporascus cannonballus]RYO90181.1 hypothetical protein DL763_005422 [Monosporascus cannonballus]RYP37113.1 hypothetical protein DL766_001687 [Monosporascus sp. MC13-8B]
MAPSAVEVNLPISSKLQKQKPLTLSGALDGYQWFDTTPVIGREFPTANLVEWLEAPNSDVLIRDLAITISQRGVVFFRAQDNLTNDLQKKLIQRLGDLSGRPATSSLHIHPLLNSERELGGDDPEISTISSEQLKQFYRPRPNQFSQKRQSGAMWHSDIAFEPVPADYSSLRLVKLPKTGGDTLWASGYEIYDRISQPYQKFLETLTATFEQPKFAEVAESNGFKLYDKSRGSMENVGSELRAVHPVVRTNPVTGWKSIFPVGGHVREINELSQDESRKLLDWFLELVYRNHDLTVRHRWTSANDIAIWDNRSTFHTATYDIEGQGERFGNRAVGIGERPYFDPQSTYSSDPPLQLSKVSW